MCNSPIGYPKCKRSFHPRSPLPMDCYKAASGGVFFRCETPKDAVYKDYKAKPLVRISVHPRILQMKYKVSQSKYLETIYYNL